MNYLNQRIISVFAVVFPLLLFVSLPLMAESKLVKKEITFTASHPFKKIPGNCKEITVKSFKVNLSDKGITLLEPAIVEVPVTGMITGNSNRDSHMLEVLEYPEFKFVEGRVNSIVSTDQENKFLIKGTLKIKGVEKPFESMAQLNKNGGSTILVGDFKIMLPDYNVEPPDLLLIRVNDEVSIHYEFTFQS